MVGYISLLLTSHANKNTFDRVCVFRNALQTKELPPRPEIGHGPQTSGAKKKI
jgi:hypothetical protein